MAHRMDRPVLGDRRALQAAAARRQAEAPRILLSGGGTAGHVMPALAVARALLALQPRAELLYVGTPDGLEADLVPRAGIPFAAVAVRPLSGRRGAQIIRSSGQAARAVAASSRMLRQVSPHVALGTGGYVAGPVLTAAWLRGTPAAIHEQNLRPGITNRWLSRMVREIYVSFADTLAHFPSGKTVHTGYPVRPEIVEANRQESARALGLNPDRPTLLISSGSLGALRINEAIKTGLPLLVGRVPGLQVVVSTGKQYFSDVRQALDSAGLLKAESVLTVRVFPFIHQMEHAYACADLVVGRAGGSVHEVLARGLPSILVPSPNVSYDQQTSNARILVEAGAAELIDDVALTGPTLAGAVTQLLTLPDRLRGMAAASARAGRPHAARDIASRLLALI